MTPDSRFVNRYLASLLIVPILPPLLLNIAARAPLEAYGSLVIYVPIGIAAMLLLGTPLLLLFLRLRWTGFLAFSLGAAFCAVVANYAVDPRGIYMFALPAALAGLVYRAILFGFGSESIPGKPHSAWIVIAVIPAVSVLFWVAFVQDRTREVTEVMQWECFSQGQHEEDGSPFEIVRFWFFKNPAYSEFATSPTFCQDLKSQRAEAIEATFLVVGSRLHGLLHYEPRELHVGPKQITRFRWGQGGYRPEFVKSNWPQTVPSKSPLDNFN